MKQYKYDVAISLCKQDVDFARKLIKAVNPTLKVFFYEDKQEDLITKSGPEAFSKIFKEESRVIVILSRNEWSESYYTEIERNAIIDKTSVKNEGFDFLMIIPMANSEIPSWYPSTRIYVDPKRFSIENIARFIEFKVTELNGKITTLTVEDNYKHLIEKIQEKRAVIQLQFQPNSISTGLNELEVLKCKFDEKISIFNERIFTITKSLPFSMSRHNGAYLGIGDFLLQCNILLPEGSSRSLFTTQDISVSFEIFKMFGETRKTLNSERRLYFYSMSFS